MSKKERKKIKKLKKKLRGYKEKELKEKKPKLNINPETRRGVVAVVLFTLAISLILSFQGVGGSLGEYLFKGSGFVFGNCLWLIPLMFLAAGIIILKDIHRNVYFSTLFGILIFILSFLGLINILFPNGAKKAGWLGYLISWPFLKIFGFWVTLVVFIAAILISILISFNISLRKIPKKEEEGEESLNKKEEKEEELIPTTKIGIKEYTFPPLELLESDKGYPSSGDVKTNVAIIQKTLENFGIPVEMGEVNVGPTVTQYPLKPAGGVKLSKITALHRDISLTLAAHPIRIEAPIPGRSLVGIEIPNKTKTLVRLRDLLAGYDYKKDGHNLNMVLGRDVAGNPVWANLVKMPHMLIAGATGSGKRMCIHSLIISLLYHKSPWEMKFILIDPKRVELPFYNGILP